MKIERQDEHFFVQQKGLFRLWIGYWGFQLDFEFSPDKNHINWLIIAHPWLVNYFPHGKEGEWEPPF